MRAGFFVLMWVLSAVGGFAQETVTMDEMIKYAVTMDSVSAMSATLKNRISEMVRDNKKVTVTRYNELSKVIDNASKLTDLHATDDEIAFVKEVASMKDEETARINKTFQSMAKEYVSPSVFNKVKKMIETDPPTRHQYDSLMTDLGKNNPSEKAIVNH